MAEKAMTVDSETQTEIAHMETEMDNHKQEEWRRPNPADIDNSSAEINNDIRQTEQQNTAVKWKERWIFNKKKYAKLQSSDRQVGHDYDNRTEKCRYYATRNGCKRGNNAGIDMMMTTMKMQDIAVKTVQETAKLQCRQRD